MSNLSNVGKNLPPSPPQKPKPPSPEAVEAQKRLQELQAAAAETARETEILKEQGFGAWAFEKTKDAVAFTKDVFTPSK